MFEMSKRPSCRSSPSPERFAQVRLRLERAALADVLHGQVHREALALLHAPVAVARRGCRRSRSVYANIGRSSAFTVARTSASAGDVPARLLEVELDPVGARERVLRARGRCAARPSASGRGRADLVPLDLAPARAAPSPSGVLPGSSLPMTSSLLSNIGLSLLRHRRRGGRAAASRGWSPSA